MSELTREQVESLLPLVSFDARQVLLSGIGFVKVHSALAIMIDADAAMRQRVQELTDHQALHDRIFERQKFLLEDKDARIAALEEEYERLTGKPY